MKVFNRTWLAMLTLMAVALCFTQGAFAEGKGLRSLTSEIVHPPIPHYHACRSTRCGGGSGGGDSGGGDSGGGDSGGGDSGGGDSGGGDSGGGDSGGGDSGPSPSEVDGDKIEGEAKSFVERVLSDLSDMVKDALGIESSAESDTNTARAANAEQQQAAALNAAPGAATECPVELHSGCKVTRVVDWANPVLPVERVHRISQGSAWSLGAGWHVSIDSRIVWGTDIDMGALIARNRQVGAAFDAIVEELDIGLDHLESGYDDRIGYDQPNARTALSEGIAELTSLRSQYLARAQKARLVSDSLSAEAVESETRRALNSTVVDPAFPTEHEIGADKIKWIAPDGGRYLFVQNDAGAVAPVSGHANQLTISSNGQISVRTPGGELYLYSDRGLLLSVANRHGQSVTVGYDGQNRPERLTDELGRTLGLVYAGDRLAKLVDAAGRTTRYSYRDGRMERVVGFDGGSQTYQYDYPPEPLAITARTDGEGNTWSYTHGRQDGKTVVLTQTDAAGNTFGYRYDFKNGETTTVNRNGSQTRRQYNANNQVTAIIHDSDGSETNRVYDGRGNLISEQNEVGDITRYRHNARGELLGVTDGEGRSTEYVRDGVGRVIRETNNAGEGRETHYDADGRVVRVEHADGSVLTQEWRDGLLRKKTDGAGNIHEYEYDGNGYPSEIILYNDGTASGDELVQRLTHDGIGRVVRVSIGSANTPEEQWRTTQYSYQSDDGRSLDKPTRIVDPLNRTALFEYDSNGLVTYHRDFSGVETLYTHTPFKKLASKHIVIPSPQAGEEPLRYDYRYQYDAENNLVLAVHPGGVVWKYTYDGRNRLAQSEILDTGVRKTFTHDESGRKITQTDSTGNTTRYDYHADGQLASMASPLGQLLDYRYDTAGRLEAVYDSGRGADTLSYQRDALGRVVGRTDGNGNTTHYQLDPLGATTAVSIPNHTEPRHAYQLDVAGRVIRTTNALGGEVGYQRNAFGEVASVTDSSGAETKQTHDGLGRVVSRTDSKGLRTEWQYDQQPHRLVVTTTKTDTLNIGLLGSQRREVKTYDLLGRLASYENADGDTWTFTYNQQGLLARTTNPDGGMVERRYGAAGHLIQQTHTDGRESRHYHYTRDGEGRVLTEVRPGFAHGSRIEYHYNELGLVSRITRPGRGAIDYGYDSAGRRTSAHYPDGLAEYWEYDANDNVILHIDRDGYRWEYTHGADNQVATSCAPAGGQYGCADVTQYRYDAMGHLVKTINPLGHAREEGRDPFGRTHRRLDAQGGTTSLELDAHGRPVVITDREGNQTRQTFNAFDQVTSVTNAGGHTVHFYYDAAGRLIERENRLGDSERWAYNHRDQVILYTDELKRQTEKSYDAFGNLTGHDREGIATTYQWTPANKLASVTNPLGHSTHLGYDEMGGLTRFENELGHTWQYDYNDLGQLIHTTQPGGGGINYTYDGRGNKTSESFDFDNRAQTNLWSYDGAGRLESISNPHLEERYHHDAAGRLIRVDNDTLDTVLDRAHDANGNLSRMALSDGVSVSYERDGNERIIALVRHDGSGSERYSLSYDAVGNLTEILYPNDTRRKLFYDAENRVHTIYVERRSRSGAFWNWSGWGHGGHWEMDEFIFYGYDAVGNVTVQNRKSRRAGLGQWSFFTYDRQDRLRAAVYPGFKNIYYGWDDAGNLTSKKSRTQAYTYHYNEANQLERSSGYPLPSIGCGVYRDTLACAIRHDLAVERQYYTYDDNGYPSAMEQGGGRQVYQHDAIGNLRSVSGDDGGRIAYGYDSRQRRVETRRLGEGGEPIQTHTSYHGRQEVTEYRVSGRDVSLLRVLTLLPREEEGLPYGLLLHQAVEEPGEHRLGSLYSHSDRLGSTIAVYDTKGRRQMRMGYSPFGEVYAKHSSHTYWSPSNTAHYLDRLTKPFPYLYTGKYTEAATGLVRMDARWYSPHNSRFVQPDYWNLRDTHLPGEVRHELMRFTGLDSGQLLDNPDQQMAYGYVSGNPLSWVDPFGLCDTSWMGSSWSSLGTLFGEYGADVVSIGVGFTPVGFGHDLVTAVTGEDPITGDEVSGWMRVAILAPGVSEAKKFGKLGDGVVDGVTKSVNPNSIRFSQNTVNGAADLTQSMKAYGWKGEAIDVVKMGDGGLTTIDNTRVLAASRAGVKVQANIRNATDALPANMVERFTTKKGVPSTWGEAVQLRVGKQNASFRNQYPNGSPYTGSVN